MARGDVLMIQLPTTDTKELAGAHPAIALQTNRDNDQPMMVVAPVTSNMRAERFRYTVRIQPDKTNGLSVPSICMVFQSRAVDRARIVRKLGQLSTFDMARIDAELRAMLSL